jgi:hypothetical protein
MHIYYRFTIQVLYRLAIKRYGNHFKKVLIKQRISFQ